MIDVAAVERSLVDGVVAFRSTRDVVLVSGSDAAEYLQGQLSQNVQGLAVGDSKPTLLLKPQGHLEAWMRLTRLADDYFALDIDHGFGDAARERLVRFAIRVDLAVEAKPMPMVAVRGVHAEQSRHLDTRAWKLQPLWSDGNGYDLLGEGAEIPSGVDEGSREAFELFRIICGAPAMGSEITDSTIAAAVGVVEQAVDFEKGCYVGQELVARIDSRGASTPFKLRGLLMPHLGVEVGDQVVRAGEVVGHVTSVAETSRAAVGLALLKRSVDVPGELMIKVSSGADDVAARAMELPLSLDLVW